MDTESTILDRTQINTEFDPRDYMVSAGKRFANYLLDIVCIYALIFLIAIVLTLAGIQIPTDKLSLNLISILFLFLYYFLFEATLGKTPAKFITKTRVVNNTGKLPEALTIAGRSLSRIVPFDAFSFLGSYARGWHDQWSHTWVIDEKKLTSATA